MLAFRVMGHEHLKKKTLYRTSYKRNLFPQLFMGNENVLCTSHSKHKMEHSLHLRKKIFCCAHIIMHNKKTMRNILTEKCAFCVILTSQGFTHLVNEPVATIILIIENKWWCYPTTSEAWGHRGTSRRLVLILAVSDDWRCAEAELQLQHQRHEFSLAFDKVCSSLVYFIRTCYHLQTTATSTAFQSYGVGLAEFFYKKQ